MRSKQLSSRERIERIVDLLSGEYGSPDLGNKSNPIDEIVFIILSEKTDEQKYFQAYDNLRSQIGSWEKVLAASLETIQGAVGCAGMGKRRARMIKEALTVVNKRFGRLDLSELADIDPKEAEKILLSIPGVGPKTARCVLLYCFGAPVLPVDIHTYRLAVRLGILSRRVCYEDAHRYLQEHIR